jgi:predicted amidophosphoribosyltransferase
MADEEACNHACTCGHAQEDHSTSGWCNACGENCANNGHYPSECFISPPDEEGQRQAPQTDPLADARSLLAEHERQQDEACRAEIEQVLAKYGRKLIVTQPQITIVPT